MSPLTAGAVARRLRATAVAPGRVARRSAVRNLTRGEQVTMSPNERDSRSLSRGAGGHGCCMHSRNGAAHAHEITRRGFLGAVAGTAVGGSILSGLTWPLLGRQPPEVPMPPARRPLVVKPILTYETPQRAHQTSWRGWGGIQTQADAEAEVRRIEDELAGLRAAADFPLQTLPVSAVRQAAEVGAIPDLAAADAVVVYAAGGWMDIFDAISGSAGAPWPTLARKPMLFFVRHRSGPLYVWYEIISPRYLRQHSDEPAIAGIDHEDVVVDDQTDLLWRLRALCGLKNTIGTRIVAVGGAGGWASEQAPQLAVERFGFDIQTVTYEELGRLISAARADEQAVALARRRAAAYLSDPAVKLETQRAFVENCFLLDQVFRSLMSRAGARAITVNACMGTIMPIAETTACLTLCTLNDDGYLAYCESDFVVIPAGVLLSNISGRPAFLNDPTFPHHGIMTLAHCTAPRKLDGKTADPARLVTHFESDYGAAPKVEFRKGQTVTLIDTDFAARKWVGMSGTIVDTPFLPVCRSQLDVQFKADCRLIAEKMRGFHWMLGYGDYLKEVGYALKRTGIAFENLG